MFKNLLKIKYIFYIISFITPCILLFFFKKLKGIDVLFLSLLSFMCYFNLCLFQKICIVPNPKDSCSPKLKTIDFKEALLIGLVSFFVILLLKYIYRFIIYYKNK